jgi:putative FmdB family regulatory protein
VPTYQYACTECGEQLEAVQSFSDPALTECPACQGKLRKVFNSVGIVFKGSGFYRNDSRAGDVSAEKPNGSTGEGKPESKSESSKSDSGKSDSNKSESSKSDSSSSSAGSNSTGSSSSSSSSPSTSSSSSSTSSSGGTKAGAASS